MTLDFFWIELYIRDLMGGFGVLSFKRDEMHRSLFSIYYNDGEIIFDLLWFRLYEAFPFWFWWFHKDCSK